MPVLAHSLSDVAAKPFGRGFKKPGRSLSIWTPRYAPIPNIKEPRKHSPFHMGFVFAISHTSRKWTNSVYSRIANSMTEKPPLDERQAKLIEVTKRETLIDRKRLRGARCKRRFWNVCRSKDFFR